MLETASLFTDGGVLCRDREIRIFGRADSGKTVTVRLRDSRGNLLAEEKGTARKDRFEITLPPQRAQTGCTLTVSSEDEQVTAAGLRYVLYAFATDLQDPAKIIAEPSGMLLGPLGRERTGDVSNVVFTNGVIADDDGRVYIYYASSDTRMHVAATDTERLCDYVFNTPEDPLRSPDCVRQRITLIRRNLAYLNEHPGI